MTRLILGCVANETLAVLGECNVTGCDAISLFVGAYFDTAVAPYGNTGIGCSEVDTDAWS